MMSTTAMVSRLLLLTVLPPWRPIPCARKCCLFGGVYLEEPEEQQQDQEYQKNDYKYWYEPTPHFLTSLARDLCLSNERQHEHGQKYHHQDDDHYGETPIYPPSPRSLSLGGRLRRNIYLFRPRRNRNGYEKAAPLSGRRG